jgi:two-component system, LytTR family, sensor kinase
MNIQWLTKKWVGVSLHILFWSLYFVSPFLLRPISDTDIANYKNNFTGIYDLVFLNNFMRIPLFYANAYVFVPKLIYKRKYGQYLLVLLAALLILMAFDRLFFALLIVGIKAKTLDFLLYNLPVFLFIIITSSAFRVIRDRIEENQRSKEKETENLKTELSFLRSQVSPHFMFNVLNNMVALARKKSDILEPSLIKLSSLLRYMLYETDEDKVALEKEIDYLKSFIELQSQRFGKNVKINADFEPAGQTYSIEPMLLIPFVENAFKHGTGLIPDARIDIHLKVQNDQLEFCVSNRFSDAITELKDKTSGIGLTNVKRRLNLLYPKNHSLVISRKDDWFSVSLQLKLH